MKYFFGKAGSIVNVGFEADRFFKSLKKEQIRECCIGANIGGQYVANSNSKNCHNVKSIIPQQRYGTKIVGDVRIDNKKEIYELLGLHSENIAPVDDCQLILSCYAKWGRGCLSYIVGEFSFALWDTCRNELFCAIDRMGAKNFFYRFIEDKAILLYSNKLGELAGASGYEVKVNETYLLDYLCGTYQESSKTVYGDIFCLPPGGALFFSNGYLDCWQYHIVDNRCVSEGKKSINYSVELTALLHEVVQCRLSNSPKSPPYGVLLSGGLDSTAITSIVSRLLQGRKGDLVSFSQVLPIDYVGGERDERSFVEQAKSDIGVRGQYCTKTGFMNHDIFTSYFQSKYTMPFNPFLCISDSLSKLVAESAVKVLFTGNGGDHIASHNGSGVLPFLAIRGRWFVLSKLLKKISSVEHRSLLSMLKTDVVKPLLPESGLNLYYDLKGIKRKIWANSVFLRKKCIGNYFPDKRATSLGSYLDYSRRMPPSQQVSLWINRGFFKIFYDLDEYILERYGVQCHHPLLDSRVIDFILTIPPTELIADGWRRGLFRKAIDGIVPVEIQYRKGKLPFCGTKGQCLFDSRNFIEEVLSKESPMAWRLINREKLRKRLDCVLSKVANQQDVEFEAYAIGRCISVVVFLQWHGV